MFTLFLHSHNKDIRHDQSLRMEYLLHHLRRHGLLNVVFQLSLWYYPVNQQWKNPSLTHTVHLIPDHDNQHLPFLHIWSALIIMDPNTIITFQGTISQDMIPIMMMYIHIFHPISNQDLAPTTFLGLLFIDHLPSLPKEVDNLRKFKDHKDLKVLITYNSGLTQRLFNKTSSFWPLIWKHWKTLRHST